MLFIDVGIVLGLYAGIRLVERRRRRQFLLRIDDSAPVAQQDGQRLARHEHYLRTSTAALTLSLAGYVVPPLRVVSVVFHLGLQHSSLIYAIAFLTGLGQASLQLLGGKRSAVSGGETLGRKGDGPPSTAAGAALVVGTAH